MFDSVTSTAMQSALDGLSLRASTVANNIANVNTPGFQASRVSFEEDLADAIEAGSKTKTAATTAVSLEPTQLNGNNVNLETETLSQIDTQLRYAFASGAVGGEARSIATAIGNG